MGIESCGPFPTDQRSTDLRSTVLRSTDQRSTDQRNSDQRSSDPGRASQASADPRSSHPYASGQLSFVKATGTGCQIHRETTGRYVVSHPGQPRARVLAATLAGAYAACRTWELSGRLLDPAI